MKLSRLARLYRYGLFYGLSQAGVLVFYGKIPKLYHMFLLLKKKAVISFIYKNYGAIIDKYRHKSLERMRVVKPDDCIGCFGTKV